MILSFSFFPLVDEPDSVFYLSFESSEEFYHVAKARKYGDKQAEDRIRAARTPAAKKAAARGIRGYKADEWHKDGAERAMRTALRAKFSQNPVHRDFLLSTKGKRLVEASHTDGFSGIKLDLSSHGAWQKVHSVTYSGENMLGRLLEEVRDHYLTVKG